MGPTALSVFYKSSLNSQSGPLTTCLINVDMWAILYIDIINCLWNNVVCIPSLHLQFPSLCHGYMRLVAYITEVHPDKVCQLPDPLLKAMMESVETALVSYPYHEPTVSKSHHFLRNLTIWPLSAVIINFVMWSFTLFVMWSLIIGYF